MESIASLKEAVHNETSVATLLRRALDLLRSFPNSELEKWINFELNGYEEAKEEDWPLFRKIKSEIKFWNPVRGWIPMYFNSSENEETITSLRLHSPITDIDTMLAKEKSTDKGAITSPLTPELRAIIKKMVASSLNGLDFEPERFIGFMQLQRIANGVRNKIMTWVLTLEEEHATTPELATEKSTTVMLKSTTNFNILGWFNVGNTSK